MDEPEVRTLADAEAVAGAGAERFVEICRDAIARRERASVALSGGSTPRLLFRRLAQRPLRDELDWSRVEFFWGDERAVPADHEESNYRMAREELLEKLASPPQRIHRMPAERPDLDRAARDYQAELARVFGVPERGQPPAFDLVLLGLGADAHTASLFPATDALDERERWVVANHVPKLAADRLTLTPVVLNRAAHVLFLVVGRDKASAVAEVLEGPRDPKRLPAQLVRPESGALTWLLDEAAASGLRRGAR